MSEIITREIIGLARKSEWNKVKEYIKELIKKTLKKNAGYTLIAIDAYINNKEESELSFLIEKNSDLKNINQIKNFSNLSIYQYTKTSIDHISISQKNGVIFLIAKYMGPEINHHGYFDFAVHIDPINDPFFTDGSGQILSCSEMLKIINKDNIVKDKKAKDKKVKGKEAKENKTKTIKIKARSEPKQIKEIKPEDIEAYLFETLIGKKALWSGKETITFKKWKKKVVNEYKKETRKYAYYKGKPTNNFIQYMKILSKYKYNKDKKPAAKKKSAQKKKDTKTSNKVEKDISEASIFETLIGKKALWSGKETITFKKWKKKVVNEYKKETGKYAYYKGKPTNNFTQYLKNLSKYKYNKDKKPVAKKKTAQKKKDTKTSNKVEKDISEASIFETLIGKKALWSGKETILFKKWKKKVVDKYKKETGKYAYYKGNPTNNFKQYMKKLSKYNKDKKPAAKKKTAQKKKDTKTSNKVEKDISEAFIFETLTGKKAVRSGKETLTFKIWKKEISEKFHKETKKHAYYNRKLTKNYKNYLKLLIDTNKD
jgi:hypothetical protein